MSAPANAAKPYSCDCGPRGILSHDAECDRRWRDYCAEQAKPPCECGHPVAFWRGPVDGCRIYCCDRCAPLVS